MAGCTLREGGYVAARGEEINVILARAEDSSGQSLTLHRAPGHKKTPKSTICSSFFSLGRSQTGTFILNDCRVSSAPKGLRAWKEVNPVSHGFAGLVLVQGVESARFYCGGAGRACAACVV